MEVGNKFRAPSIPFSTVSAQSLAKIMLLDTTLTLVESGQSWSGVQHNQHVPADQERPPKAVAGFFPTPTSLWLECCNRLRRHSSMDSVQSCLPGSCPNSWFTPMLCHTLLQSALRVALGWERNSPSTQITDICSENVLLISNWSKAKRKFTLAASEQRICSDVSPHQVLSVDRINKVHCYEPWYRISMLWVKQLLVTWDTMAADTVTAEHLAVTQQHQHAAMQRAGHSVWPLTERLVFCQYIWQCCSQWLSPVHSTARHHQYWPACYIANAGARLFPETW